MIKIRKSVIFAGVALAALAGAVQDGILLRRTLTEGETDTYSIETVTKQTVTLPNGMGEQEMGSTMLTTYKLKTGKIDPAKKTAAMELTFTVDKMDTEGMAAMPGATPTTEIGKPFNLTATMDEFGRLKIDPPKGSNPVLATLLTSSNSLGGNLVAMELPEKALKVGDTWDIPVPKSPLTGTKDQKLVAKLVGEKDVDGKSAYVVSTTGTLQIDADMSKMAEEGAPEMLKGQKMLLKGQAKIESNGVIEKSSGRTLRMTSKVISTQTMEMPDMGMSVGMTGTVTTVSTLK
jgi:hypothetical protein